MSSDGSTELRPTWLTASPAFLQAVVEKLRASAGGRSAQILAVRACRRRPTFPSHARVELQRLLATPVVEFYGLCEAGMMTGAGASAGRGEGRLGRTHPRRRACHPRRTRQHIAGRAWSVPVMLRGPSVMPGYLSRRYRGRAQRPGRRLAGDRRPRQRRRGRPAHDRRPHQGNHQSRRREDRALRCRKGAARATPPFARRPRLPCPIRGSARIVGAAVVLHPGAKATSTELIDFRLRSARAVPKADGTSASWTACRSARPARFRGPSSPAAFADRQAGHPACRQRRWKS